MPAQDFTNFLGRNPDFTDFVGRANRTVDRRDPDGTKRFTTPVANQALEAGTNLLQPFNSGLANNAQTMGLARLNEILARGGKADPALLNRNLVASNRDTEGNVNAIQEEMARRGLGGSLAGVGLEGAAREAGSSRNASLRADELAREEGRKRTDLGLMQQLVTDPAIDLTALGMGQFNANQKRSDDRRDANTGALTSLAAAFIGGS